MNYSKIIKLASYFKGKDVEVFSTLLKLAYSDKFLSMVLGSYPSRGGAENEIKMRRKIVAKMINDSSDVDSTVVELAKIVKENSDIKEEDHSQIWDGHLTKEQISELEKLLASGGESRSSRGDPFLSDLFSKLNGVKRYHDSVRTAIKELVSQEWYVPRSSGPSTLGKIEVYNPATKEARFLLGISEKGWRVTKDIKLEDILLENTSKNRDQIRPLQWLSMSDIFPLSIERSRGGTYDGCLLSSVIFDGNIIVCTFDFVTDNFVPASKEIHIDSGYAPSFYWMNRGTLDSF